MLSQINCEFNASFSLKIIQFLSNSMQNLTISTTSESNNQLGKYNINSDIPQTATNKRKLIKGN